MAQANCPKCDGTGWKIVAGEREVQPAEQRVSVDAGKLAETHGVHAFAVAPENGSKGRASAGLPRMAVPCECTLADEGSRQLKQLERARVPTRYRDFNFESYRTDLYDREGDGPQADTWNRSLAQAKLVVEGFAKNFPLGTKRGLMLMGTCGVGKTHLAVAALKKIVLGGHGALFYDYRDLLRQIKHSYNPESHSTEMGVLRPLLKTELLLLDDLGAERATDWARDIVGYILTNRYNENRITLITTNVPDRVSAPLMREVQRTADSDSVMNGPSDSEKNRPISREETLTDRITARIRSRLYEMCQAVEISGLDRREFSDGHA